jgi:RNA-directed DNA polymerase
VLRRMSTVIDLDLSRYFDTIRHSVLLDKIARRIQDAQILHLVKQIIKVGEMSVSRKGDRSARWRRTSIGTRWTGSLTRVELNQEKTKVVDTLKGEAFGFLGFELRRVRKRKGDGYFIRMTPKKKARQAVKAKIRDIVGRGGATPMPEVVKQINATLAGWVNYFRVGNSSRAFSEVRDYVEMKVRTLLTRRKRRRKSSVGWRRWSNEYLYDILELYWDWKIQPLPGVGEGK